MSTISKSIGITLLILAALLLSTGSTGYLAAGEENVAVTLFSQPPDPDGGLYQSSWWSPNESNFDKYLWDNFTLTNTQDITGIQWRGGYDPNVLNGAGTVVDFEVAIYASNGNEPAYLIGPLATYQTGGNAGETPAGTAGGVAMYDYSFTLPAAFQAQGGTMYWVYIVAAQAGNPDWGLSKGTNGDTQHFRINHDGSVVEFRSGDLAFTLLGPPAPYGVSLSSDQNKSAAPGQSVIYTVTATNTGTMTDSVDLDASGQTWATTLSASQLNLAPSASKDFTVTVSIPPGAADQDSDMVTITATSQGDSSKTDSASLTTTSVAAPIYGVALSADDSLSGPIGGQVFYTLTVTNTGTVADSFDLAASGQAWTTNLSTSQVNLAPAASSDITVTVSIPPGATDQESDMVTITATSQGDSSKTASASLTTTSVAAPNYGVALSADDSLSAAAGGQVFYTLTVTNTGNVTDSFDLAASGQTWTTTLSSSLINLGPSASVDVTVTVDIPPGTADQDSDMVTITATSQGDNSKTDSAVFTTISTGQPPGVYLPIVLSSSSP